MCGIAGAVGCGGVDRALLGRMCDVIRHRGPDDEGYFVEGDVGLGMRRLAIIDVAHGQQPITNEDGTVVVVFNGEIYNHPDLRAQLEARGHRLTSSSDTECIAHLYEDHGVDFVHHLRGMFAIALWDRGRSRLVLARDRVGKKPLYYALLNEGVVFGSELKVLLQHPAIGRRVDPLALHHYLTYQYVPAPWSILEGVSKLPPAHLLVWENGVTSVRPYWSLDYHPKLRGSAEELGEELRRLILEATAMRLISERPVGAFLSGGLDSSVVVAAMAQLSPEPVKTFSIGFNESRFDERRWARMVADRYGTTHHELVVPAVSALDELPAMTWHYDEPYADSSAITTFQLARLTRDQVTVALNGDGGDESFAGYSRHLGFALAARIPDLPGLRPTLGFLADHLPEGRHRRSRLTLGRRFLGALSAEADARYVPMVAAFTNEQKAALYSADQRSAVDGVDSYSILTDLFAASADLSPVDRVLSVDTATYLPGDLLVKVDIASMAHSLEARSPLLDQCVMEFAARLPPTMKIKGRQTKFLLKQAARPWLPDELIHRSKMGFGVPLAEWLRGALRTLAWDLLTDEVARQRGYFEPSAVRELLLEHEAGRDHAARIWTLLQFESWHRAFLDRPCPTGPCPS